MTSPARLSAALATALALALPAHRARAQTDYYNTDAGRPVRIEDAYPVERHAFELQLAPLRLERMRGGVYSWGVEPEIAYGILPRTQVEIGAPLSWVDAGGGARRGGLAGLHVSVLHALNVETRTLPAFGIAATAIAPLGALAPADPYASLKLLATRTFRVARVHVNGEHTFGGTPSAEPGGEGDRMAHAEIARWLAGVAIDRTSPLRALLVTAEIFVRRPLGDAPDVEWTAGAGLRHQLDPRFALDAGLGRRLTGDDRAWYVTVGVAYAFAIRALIRVPGR